MKHLIIIIVSGILCSINLHARESYMKVLSLMADETDVAATQRKLPDPNGSVCALLRVLIVDSLASFTGPYVELDKKVNQYDLWMNDGSTFVKVKNSYGDSLNIKFSNYGIKRLEKLNVYVLTIDSPLTQFGEATKTGLLKLTVVPRTALVKVDGAEQKLRFGRLSMPLLYGSHVVEVEVPGKGKETRNIEITERPVEIDIKLN